MAYSLKGKVIVVTASTQGIGLATVRAAAAAGATVFMGARNLEKAEALAKEMVDAGQDVRVVYNDATQLESYGAMIEEVVKQTGRVDGLVNNFGHTDVKLDLDVEHTDFENFRSIVDTNLASVFLPVQAALPHMQKQGGGSIVNVSSVGGLFPDISRTAYGVSKDAINYLTRVTALQQGAYNIRVNAVCPGQTATAAVMNNMSEFFQNMFNRHTPLHRMGKPEEIAGAIVYFLSDEAAYTTGQIIAVSGGFGIGTPVYADFCDLAAQARG